MVFFASLMLVTQALFADPALAINPSPQFIATLEDDPFVAQQVSKLNQFREFPVANARPGESSVILLVETDVKGTVITLNERQAIDAMALTALREGSYTLEAKANHYADFKMPLLIKSGMLYRIKIEMVRPVGFLEVHSETPGVAWTVDGAQIPKRTPLGEGRHILRGVAFGFNDIQQDIVIEQTKKLVVNAQFTPATFDLSGLSVSRQALTHAIRENAEWFAYGVR